MARRQRQAAQARRLIQLAINCMLIHGGDLLRSDLIRRRNSRRDARKFYGCGNSQVLGWLCQPKIDKRSARVGALHSPHHLFSVAGLHGRFPSIRKPNSLFSRLIGRALFSVAVAALSRVCVAPLLAQDFEPPSPSPLRVKEKIGRAAASRPRDLAADDSHRHLPWTFIRHRLHGATRRARDSASPLVSVFLVVVGVKSAGRVAPAERISRAPLKNSLSETRPCGPT